MRRIPSTAAALLAFVLLTALAACPGERNYATGGVDSNGDPMSPDPTPPEPIARILECTKQNPQGGCVENTCTQGPGGFHYSCLEFAKNCLDHGLHWKGTKEFGACSVVSP